MSENGTTEKVVVEDADKAQSTMIYYPLILMVETPAEIMNKIIDIDVAENGDLSNRTWVLFSNPGQRKFTIGLPRLTESQSTGFASHSLESIFSTCQSLFDPFDDDAPVNGTILGIIDERTLRDGTIILAEGATEYIHKPNSVVIIDDQKEEFKWRWVRVEMEFINQWMGCIVNKALLTVMPKPGSEDELYENGSLLKGDF